MNEYHEYLDDQAAEQEQRASKGVSALKLGYGCLVSGLVGWLLWAGSQSLLAVYVAHPTWREQLGAWGVLVVVCMVGLAGLLSLFGPEESEHEL
jgi:uncharacterized iron-regulated membrane protein